MFNRLRYPKTTDYVYLFRLLIIDMPSLFYFCRKISGRTDVRTRSILNDRPPF